MYTLMLWFEYGDSNKNSFLIPAFKILRIFEGGWHTPGFTYVQLPEISLVDAEGVLEKLKEVGFEAELNCIRKIKFKVKRNADSKIETFIKNEVVSSGEYTFK